MTQTSGSVMGLTPSMGPNGPHGTSARTTDADFGFCTPEVNLAALMAENGMEGSDDDPDG